jgi:hypothetical protein
MYGGGASSRSGGEAWYETRSRFGAANDNAWTVNHCTGTDIGALTDEALTIVPWDSTCGPDCLQQSEALSFIGQSSWPALQQAICCVTVAVAPSTHVAHVEVRTATTTSSEASARLQRTIVSIVCRGERRVNFVATSWEPRRHRRPIEQIAPGSYEWYLGHQIRIKAMMSNVAPI